MSNSKKEDNEKIRMNMLSAFSKICSAHTVSIGNEIVKMIVHENENNEAKTNYILSLISEHINSQRKGEKKESIKILTSLSKGMSEVTPYLSRILTIFQSNIIDDNASIFTTISSTFAEIVETSIKSDNSESKENKTRYELFQGFCIYNMKQDTKANQICGSLCLTALIETCPLILQPAYMKYIWENIIFFIDKPHFNAKSELLNALISLIFASENLFKAFSTVTLYKILDYLTDSDWFRRKLALNVVYTLIIYCQEEILPLKGHIVEFLRVLKSDKVKEVREVCMQTLKLFNEIAADSEPDAEVKIKTLEKTEKTEKKDKSFIKNISSIMEMNDISADSINANDRDFQSMRNKNEKSPKLVKKKSSPIICKRNSKLVVEERKLASSGSNSNLKKSSEQIITKKIVKSTSSIAKSESAANLVLASNNLNSLKNKNIPKSNLNIFGKKIRNSLDDDTLNISEIKSDERANKNEKKKAETNLISSVSPSLAPSNVRRPLTPNKLITVNKKSIGAGFQMELSDDEIATNPNNTSKRIAKVNRKEDNTFVNSKMVINRDPEHSIFKTPANQEFFSNASKDEEIQIVFKEKKENILLEENNLNEKTNQMMEEKMKNRDMPLKLSGEVNTLSALRNSNLYNNNNQNVKSVQKSDSFGDKEKEKELKNESHHISEKEENYTKQQESFSTLSKQDNSNLYNYGSANNKYDMSEVIKQMKFLSDKQLSLMDTLEKQQDNSKLEFDNMSNRIINLENTVQYLVNYIKNFAKINNGVTIIDKNEYSANILSPVLTASFESNTINKDEFDSFGGTLNQVNYSNLNKKKTNSAWSDILQELKNKKPIEAFRIALRTEENNLIKLIEKISYTQIKEVDKTTVEEIIKKLILFITNGNHLSIVMTFMKNLLINLNYEVRQVVCQNIYDALLFTASNKIQFKITNEDMIDINLLISYINSKLNSKGGFSNLINSFANNM